VAIGGFGVVWSKAGTRRAGFSHLIVGLGLMLMGLEFMKSGSISATNLFDPAALSIYPAIVFLAVGFLLTAIIQSSSATIMITLSALYAGVIPLTSAAAVAIGADLGTTITALLGALVGSVAKKRVAAAIILFNVVTDAIAFAFLKPILRFITEVIGLSDPLFALVAFHTLFNLMGLILFMPLIPFLSRQLGRRFSESLHAAMHAEIYKEIGLGKLEEKQISTLLNVNRELYLSNQSLLEAIADAALDMDSARDYESLPAQQR
jgi:phosphate:Na+ symporter